MITAEHQSGEHESAIVVDCPMCRVEAIELGMKVPMLMGTWSAVEAAAEWATDLQLYGAGAIERYEYVERRDRHMAAIEQAEAALR